MVWEAGRGDRCHPRAVLCLPAQGLQTLCKQREGTAVSFPDLQDSLLQGFLLARGLARLQYHPPHTPQRVLSRSEGEQVKHGDGKPSGLTAVNRCV